MKRAILALLLAATTALLGAGCRTVAEDDSNAADQLPWNTPASWEGQVIGVPY